LGGQKLISEVPGKEDSEQVVLMGCWKWFSSILKEAGIDVTEENRAKIDEVIHDFVGGKARYEHCSPDWSKIGKKIREDENERKRLIAKLRTSLS